jgi:cytochrome c peroxidase
MSNEPKRNLSLSAYRPGDAPPSKPTRRNVILATLAGSMSACLLLLGVAAADDNNDSAVALREFIDHQVGGIDKLKVPASDAAIPLPRQADGTVNPRYKTTEEKRYLGKLLFHDPIRTARIDPNYGGLLATKQTGSCGSCHLGEADGKAGAVLNFSVGGEGRGYTDENGNFIVRRRPRTDILPKLRENPLFPGDALVDSLPTLTDVYLVPPAPGHLEVDTPARQEKLPPFLQLVATGRLDALDSVGRQSPSMIGFAFNNRLLLGGLAGEPDAEPGALNPFGDPAQENLTLLLLDAHRMLTAQSAELQKFPAFVKLFRDAFPEEAAQADAKHDINLLINDQTVLRATATFLRTTVTRNTPFDRFLAGDNHALTPSQLRGAKLFFTPATGGHGGAGCSTCHSGPMFNKQHDDPDVAGIGQFVEENFVNVGIGDHPLQALGRLVRNDPNFHDEGRKETTRNEDAAFRFRVVTLRQLKDARTFFHNGSFTSVRDVVKYFNDGVPQDPTAGAAPTLSTRFTNPRGPGSARGLGLSDRQIDDLTDFLENALYDPAFVKYDPNSTTSTLQPNERDLTYSKYRPDLAALGAKDGFVISGLATDNNDPLSRRDEGLEFLDVTSQVHGERIGTRGQDGRQMDTYRFTNTGSSVVDTHLLIVVRGLADRIRLENASGITSSGDPYIRVFLRDGVLPPEKSIARTLVFRRRGGDNAPPLDYSLDLLSGQGNP